jgi:glycosyltransferase involved in cell wall biosynthesis
MGQTQVPAELILVDDQSGDGSLDLLKLIQSKYGCNQIKVVSLTVNQGAASARNAGWDVATQPYVAFLDADDAWHPLKIEIQLEWMLKHPGAALTGHACQIVMMSEKNDSEDNSVDVTAFLGVDFKKVESRALLTSNPFPTRSVMLRRDLPHRFFAGKRYSEDYLLWCEILLDGYACYLSPLPLAFMFKADYGEAGLSGNLWAMEKGELDTYRKLFCDGRIGRLLFSALFFWSIAKYVRRCINVRSLRFSRGLST